MTSDMTQQMKLTDMTIGNVMNGGVKAAARVVLMLLILVAGVGEMWAQTDYSGTYYLRNTQTNNQNYYLVPAVGGYYNNNEATPYLTTYTQGYYALHLNGTGYLKVNGSDVALSNDGTFRSGNLFGDGNSIWVITPEGYLQNEYYYLNVANNRTLYLSVTPETRWTLEDVANSTKKHLYINDGSSNLYLCNDGGIKVSGTTTKYYSACPMTVTELENGWSDPTTDALTLLSPQQVTYLRHYFTQKISYSFTNDAGGSVSNTNNTRRIYATLEYSTTSDADKGSTWDIEDNIIYSKQPSGNVAVTAKYKMLPADPIARSKHAEAVEKDLKFTLLPKTFSPADDTDYLLFHLNNGSFRFPYDDGITEGQPVKPYGTKSQLTWDPKNPELSWHIETDEAGFVMFKNVKTGRYLYFDAADYTNSDYGAVKVGATSVPGGADGTKYKFRLFKLADDGTYGSNIVSIIPYEKQFVIFKSDGRTNNIFGGLWADTNNRVLTLNKPADYKWKFYPYEVEDKYCLKTDYGIEIPNTIKTGQSATITATGTYDFKAESYHWLNIKGAPGNNNTDLDAGKGTKKDIVYQWEITGEVAGYIETLQFGQTNVDKSTFKVNVISMPEAAISGKLKVTASVTSPEAWNAPVEIVLNIAPPLNYEEPTDFEEITSLSAITKQNGHYRLTADATDRPSVEDFKGVLDGGMHTVSGLSASLFKTLSGAAVVRNLTLKVETISGEGPQGAVAGQAQGNSRIYNVGVLSGSIGSTNDCCGGLVGSISGMARVINCFSYANITGGTDVGGIVGYNDYASTSSDIKTMVMNCMFYGNASGNDVAPIYNGEIIDNNSATGLNNFNYFSFKDFTSTINTYNCALGAEERFLKRFEFYRQILNSNRELAAWYVTGSTEDARTVMAKWVLDKEVAEYPILKPQGQYPSIINYDASAGESLGTLSVSISQGTKAPAGAAIKTGSLTLTRTDKDPDNFNFNYDKVQLPYYNDIGTGNYTDNKVVVGWEITGITGGGTTTYSTGTDVTVDEEGKVTATPYNFADRNCTEKDLYGTSGRVFSQGAYFDVPTGVTAITIQPHWAVAAYLSDPNYDKTYTNNYAGTDIKAMGTRYNNKQNYTINGSSQMVYTNMGDAITGLGRRNNSSVYDYAVVLVGNYHHYYGNSSIINDKSGFTIMSADLDFDNEPDNCFIYQHTNRQPVSPIRFDFLCWSGIGMAQKPSNSTRMPDIGIFKPRGWFEVTNTCLTHFYQFEYDWSTKDADQDGSPLILLGGIYEQFVSSNDGAPTHTKYIHLGSNAWFKMFNNGIHADWDHFTPHKPISVTGGDYDLFYLSGMFRPDATANEDHAECYISGGYFGEVAGAGMEKINGDVYWQIDHADIEAFYGGGINAAQPVQGDITTDITNSNVTTFCGGPKFGDMVTGKKVTTTASGCTFGQYFGAGYGGTSLNRIRKYNLTNSRNYNFNSSWVSSYSRAYETSTKTTPNGTGGPTNDITVNAIATNYEYELFPFSGFANDNNVGRFYVNYASLSLATTRNVTSTLTGCKITGNFYGGGSLGKVDGDVNSTLKDCTVHGNVFGAGFSATAPTVKVFPKEGFATEPRYDGKSGTYTQGVYPTPVTYTWHQVSSVSAGNEFDETNKLIYTTEDMTTLGTVVGDVTLNIEGTTSVGGSVYGGGEESAVSGDVAVNMTGGTMAKNVFGGGKGMADSFQCEKAMVGVNGDGVDHPAGGTTVTITGGTVNGSVYGGGEVGRVEKNTVVTIGTGDGTATAEASPVINGSVYGGGKGVSTHGYAALVRGNATVNVTGNAAVMQSVYGGGEIASVGRYTIAQTAAEAAEHDVEIGEPYSLANDVSGNCRVTVGGYAEIGRDDMQMKAKGGPDDTGYVFGAGKGVLPYEGYAAEETPWRQTPGEDMASNDDDGREDYGAANEEYYIKYIGTLALATQTFVTIKDHAFIKGSVYGGSENGHVQHDTDVTIQDHCQIGNGWDGTSGVNERYDEADFINPATATAAEIEAKAAKLHECASWDYGVEEGGKMVYHPYDKYEARGGASTTATDGHTFFGNVFGGGSGLYPYLSRKDGVGYEWIRTAGQVGGNTSVTITGGHILTSVYGGCELTDVGNSVTLKEGKGKCTVKMSGGTLGVPRTLKQIAAHPVTCYLFGGGKGDQRVHFNQWTNVGSAEVEVSGNAIIYGSVFGGGEDGHVLGDVKLTIKDETTPTGEGVEAVTTTTSPVIGTWGTSYVDGNIFGGGRGFGGDALTAGVVSGNVQIDIQGGTMLGSIYGGGRLGSVGTYLVPENHENYGKLIPNDTQQKFYDEDIDDATGVTHGYITINVSGGTIGNNYEYVYPTDTEKTGLLRYTSFDARNRLLYTKGGNIFTGCMGRLYELDGTTLLPHWADMAKARKTKLNITGGTIKSSVYGGGELGTLVEGATVSITGGTVGTLVPAGADEEQTAYYYGSVFGGGKGSTDDITGKWPTGTADDKKTDISMAGQVGGNVLVELNKGVAEDAKGGIVHQIFGCNDMNGSPKGTVAVHVYSTQNEAAATIGNPAEGEQTAKVAGRYDVEAVYGGGNLAAYVPTAAVSGTDEEKKTAYAHVIIDGCGLTSIRQVYGGGNAASTPATLVDINETFEIDEAFGGGNGKDLLPSGDANPGANVGFYDYSAKDAVANGGDGTYDTKEKRQVNEFVSAYTYGSGKAAMNIHGGTVHRVYGGSNTKGNVREVALTLLEEESGCPFNVDEAYGGGKSAPMDAESRLEMACIPGLKAAYGGAEDAEIEGDVNMTITNGTFDRVFGGNNVSGYIKGTITVNIEETGCRPVIIGQLYGGGNQAPYTAPDGQSGPTLNVRSFTSIGEVYGGGYGATAVVTGDTHVNINVSEGQYYDDNDNVFEETIKNISFTEYKRTTDGSFVLDDDGNRVEENKTIAVTMPGHAKGTIGAIYNVYGGGNSAKVIGNTFVNIGTTMGEQQLFETPTGATEEVRTKTVLGADIRGDVFGGGNTADVTGNTNVDVGK